jgi:filamentous hemagglutinin family protein
MRIAALVVSFAGLSSGLAAFAAGVLPQGGHYVAGVGTIAGLGDAITITQPGSTRGVIDWTGFSIGAGNTVTFDNGTGATLNRMTGGSRSMLSGNLNATGSVYLINPQGILVGRSGVISTGGRFVASTLDLPNDAFMNSGTLTLSGATSGKVVNFGKISSSGGDVFLISHDVVENAGSVSAPNGTAEYIAGQQVVLYESSNSRQVFVQIASRGTVVDRGTTEAAQLNLQAADGNLYALAGSGSRIRATGTATRDGHIWLVAGNGHVTQQGTLEATNVNGTGGTVDTLANTLTLQSDAAVQAGLWNVSTPNFTVDGATAGALMRSLNAGTLVDATATGTNGASGDLNVESNITWSGPASLALTASHNVSISRAATLKNTGSGNLSVRADAASIDNAGSVTNNGTIDWSGSTGIVSAMYDMNGTYSPGTIVTNSAWLPPAESGLVTQSTAYRLVNSLPDLQNINNDLAGNYALGKDFDMTEPSGRSNTPIGDFTSSLAFNGQFDGMGHTVSNLRIYSQPASNLAGAAALFADIGATGVVRNMNVQGTVSGDSQYNYYGILAAFNHGTIAGVHTSGNVNHPTGNGEAGGLVAENAGTITRSSSDVDIVTSDGGFGGGGLVDLNSGYIRQSFASGSVTVESGGGLVGGNIGSIYESYATGPVSYSHTCQLSRCEVGNGALAGINVGFIGQSFATGKVNPLAGQPPPAGIVSSNQGSIAYDVYWDATTTGSSVASITMGGGSPPASHGLTTAQMSRTSSFGPTYDFSANGVWAMPAGATHPVLRWSVQH